MKSNRPDLTQLLPLSVLVYDAIMAAAEATAGSLGLGR